MEGVFERSLGGVGGRKDISLCVAYFDHLVVSLEGARVLLTFASGNMYM